MKTMLALVLLVGIAWSPLFAGTEEKLPPAAREALAKMNQDIDKTKSLAVVALKKVLQEEMRKGNVKAAALIEEKIDELSNATSLVGTWSGNGGYTYELKEDGEVVCGANRGKWTINNSKLSLIFPNVTDSYDLPPKRGVLKGANSFGRSAMITKDR